MYRSIRLFLIIAAAMLMTQRVWSKDPKKPNVVLIISDDQAYWDYGFMGHKVIKTPQLDKLASQSLLYTRGYVTTALCSPSLATMLTGLYPHQHGITGNDPSNKNRTPFYKAFEKCPRLPALLKDAGYDSFQTGKFWLGHYKRAGFTDGMTVNARHGDISIGRQGMKPAFDFMGKCKKNDKPFFLWYAPMMPHKPHTPPKEILQKYAKSDTKGKKEKKNKKGKKGGSKNALEDTTAEYYAMVDWFDQTCGQLLDYLDKNGLADNTIVLYICDNGWPYAQKGSPYEGGIRTPIMIKWPNKIKPRRDETTLASNLDIVPTILNVCGVKPPKEMTGLNLMDQDAMSKRTMVFGENFTHDMMDVDQPAKSLRCRTVITKDFWKLTVWQDKMPSAKTLNKRVPKGTTIELFNLKEDPAEKVNLEKKHPDRVKDMTKLINEWWNPNEK